MFSRTFRTSLIFWLLVVPRSGTLNISQLPGVICSAYSGLIPRLCPASWSVTLCVHSAVFSKYPREPLPHSMQISGFLSLLLSFLDSALQTATTSASQTSSICSLILVTLLCFTWTLPPHAAAQQVPPCWKAGSPGLTFFIPSLSDPRLMCINSGFIYLVQWSDCNRRASLEQARS